MSSIEPCCTHSVDIDNLISAIESYCRVLSTQTAEICLPYITSSILWAQMRLVPNIQSVPREPSPCVLSDLRMILGPPWFQCLSSLIHVRFIYNVLYHLQHSLTWHIHEIPCLFTSYKKLVDDKMEFIIYICKVIQCYNPSFCCQRSKAIVRYDCGRF